MHWRNIMKGQAGDTLQIKCQKKASTADRLDKTISHEQKNFLKKGYKINPNSATGMNAKYFIIKYGRILQLHLPYLQNKYIHLKIH